MFLIPNIAFFVRQKKTPTKAKNTHQQQPKKHLYYCIILSFFFIFNSAFFFLCVCVRIGIFLSTKQAIFGLNNNFTPQHGFPHCRGAIISKFAVVSVYMRLPVHHAVVSRLNRAMFFDIVDRD